MELADEFVTDVTTFAATLAKHRRVQSGPQVGLKDIKLSLQRRWQIGPEDIEKSQAVTPIQL